MHSRTRFVWPWIRSAARSALFIYLGVCLLLFLLQRHFIYHPPPSFEPASATVMRLTVDGADLQVTTMPRAGPKAIVYFGGNAEDVNQSLPGLMAAFPDQSIYLMNYRSYGGSTGEPSERALVADALALFDQMRSAHEEITAIGRSLGSGVAVQLASQRPVAPDSRHAL